MADEDASNQGNTVLTTVIHPSQNAHVVTTPLTHYSMTTLLTNVGHSACIRNGCAAPDFAGAFGLKIS
jgi:acid phosphatase